jgi:hypothetical protein
MTGKITYLICCALLVCAVSSVQALVTVTTEEGNGADTYLSNDGQGGDYGPDSVHGANVSLRAFRQLVGVRSKTGYIRFDLSNATGDMSDAILTFDATFLKGSAKTVQVYGLIDGSGDFWDESTVSYNTAPGVLPADLGNCTLDTDMVTLLGTITTPAAGGEYPVSFSSNPSDLPLTSFLNADTNKLVTFLFIGTDNEGEIASKEHETFAAPSLTLPNAVFGARTSAGNPNPPDGTLHMETWVNLAWMPGASAVSHNVYLGENFDDVNDGTGDTFRGNQTETFYLAGFPGNAYPDGLINGTTYYWRIDEVNDADPNSPWKGNIWSFTVPPKTAYIPDPADGAELVDLNVTLTWTPGFGAKLHYIVFGEDFDEVNNAETGVPAGLASYNPGPLNLAKTYYWRVDESDGTATYTGEVWSFTTEGAVSGPDPSNDAVGVNPTVVLGWDAGAVAESHEVYFGTDAETVKNATKTSPEYKGARALGQESYDPGRLKLNTTYYWRIDEVNDAGTDSPWIGNVWSFTTGDFFVIDDFEDYDAGENQIWYAWLDGLGYGTPDVPPYSPGNGTGAAVGDETTASYTEETIVHEGGQSMPFVFDNNKQGYAKYSEVEHALTGQRNWTEEGIANLSLWFRGYPPSTGSFVEGPIGTFTMTGSGADIWDVTGVGEGFHDEFHFAYKTLSGPGSIVARVESVDNTDGWAKAGVMIRSTLDGNSIHAMMVVSAASGVSFQRRPETGAASAADTTAGITAPYWVKIERTLAGNIIAYSSADGSAWQMLGAAEAIQTGTNAYIGLAVTSHNAARTCQAIFSNVTTTGNVGAQWAHQDVGILSNDAEPLYVAVSNTGGNPAVVVFDNPAASQIETWTEWTISLQDLAEKGLNLNDVDKIAIGIGTRGNMTTPGGSGKMYFDDIRLYGPGDVAVEE